ncbi:PREDICTED: uncharacterized protein LOC109359880 [Lupinus angustifolius]|uniref:uncharacterized protein LOC109359880 n=1 Tax=Lupinus angustifolius TaxID=3871 RepID=UPI00092EAC87|nr:PREDICTED: uncharacterized protein LOC109359880 [Lupinus angustifolius]
MLSGLIAIIIVYVDDIILAGNHLQELNSIKHLLDSSFKIKDLGDLRFFLGFEIARQQSGISINQRKYALELVSDVGLLRCKPSKTPMTFGTHLHQDPSPLYSDAPTYRRLIGRLIYLTNTRPDITFVINQLAQFMGTPTTTHHNAALKVL